MGAEELARSVDVLRAPGDAVSGTAAVPEKEWPETLRALRPESVSLGRDGVFVKLDSGFAGEEGLFIAYAGVSVATDRGTDPSFERLEGRVYWYRIKG